MSERMSEERLARLRRLAQNEAIHLDYQGGQRRLAAAWEELRIGTLELEAENRELRRRINEALAIAAGSVSIGWLPNKMVETLKGEK